jgi:hypothetical protein
MKPSSRTRCDARERWIQNNPVTPAKSRRWIVAEVACARLGEAKRARSTASKPMYSKLEAP